MKSGTSCVIGGIVGVLVTLGCVAWTGPWYSKNETVTLIPVAKADPLEKPEKAEKIEPKDESKTYTYMVDSTGKRRNICPSYSIGRPETRPIDSGKSGTVITCINPVTREPMQVYIKNIPFMVYPVEMP